MASIHSHNRALDPSSAAEREARSASTGFEVSTHFAGLRPAWSGIHSLREAFTECPRDRFASFFSSALEADPGNLSILLSIYRDETDEQLKTDYFRALRTSIASHSHVIRGSNLAVVAPGGLRNALAIHELPTGPRQGAGLLTNFHLISQLALGALPRVRFLPLPRKFPTLKPVSPTSVCEYPGSRNEVFDLSDYAEVRFGRSVRFESRTAFDSGAEHSPEVLKAARTADQDALALLRYEAAVMTFLQHHRDYFGLESDLPIPARGPRNQVAAWGFSGSRYLLYSAPCSYFQYLDELTNLDEVCEAGCRAVRDLMRLATFGIFHTELAPIFHSVAQQRPFIWNVGGLLPGAGDLEYWKESFTHANIRRSGIADFEHLRRWPKMWSTVAIVNDTSHGPDLGLQYHVGNVLFSTLHVMALAFRRNGSTFSDRPHAFSQVLQGAFEAFTGRHWAQFVDDVDDESAVAELSAIGGGDHIGEFSGAYPYQNILKAITAFTLRAITEFVDHRKELYATLPEPTIQQIPVRERGRRRMPVAEEIQRVLFKLRESGVIKSLEEAGVGSEDLSRVVGSLRLSQVVRASDVNTETGIRFFVSARGLYRALCETLGRSRAESIACSVLFEHSDDARGSYSLFEASRLKDCWIAAG